MKILNSIFPKKFNAAHCKSHLKMACTRAKQSGNKLQANLQTIRREVAILLREGKEEKAAIKVEQILHEEKMSNALDILETICDQMSVRLSYLEGCKTVPDDMQSTVSTVLYCSGRVDVQELNTIRDMVTQKFGKEFVEKACQNKNGLVNSKLVEFLTVRPPTRAEVVKELENVARMYNVPWIAPEEIATLDAAISPPSADPAVAPVDVLPDAGQVPLAPSAYQTNVATDIAAGVGAAVSAPSAPAAPPYGDVPAYQAPYTDAYPSKMPPPPEPSINNDLPFEIPPSKISAFVQGTPVNYPTTSTDLPAAPVYNYLPPKVNFDVSSAPVPPPAEIPMAPMPMADEEKPEVITTDFSSLNLEDQNIDPQAPQDPNAADPSSLTDRLANLRQ
eukprot:Platyproteum_vivax@DN7450_c0_g2_i1.p1